MWTSVCLFVLLWSSLIEGEPVVETPLGRIVGKVDVTVDELQLETFLGIPYAKPPIGDLRFEFAQPLDSLGDVLEAKEFGPVCAQPSIFPEVANATLSEDCLSLNVFRPFGTKKGDKMPVLAIIHGGSFAFGGTVNYSLNGAPMAALNNIMVVTINYRLGIYGFADMGDDAPGNLGLYDQVMGLQWIKTNIGYFGGDPEMVTLMGTSAGSMSVNSIIISPISRDRNLFQAAIMDGGVMARGWFLPPDVGYKRLKEIAKKLNCPNEGSDMVKCLRKVDEKILSEISYDPEYSPDLTFHPTLDGKFLMEDFERDLREHADEYAKVKMILGTTKDEGTMFVRSGFEFDFGPKQDPVLETEEDFLNWCQKLSYGFKQPLNFKDESLRKSVIDTYMKQYTESKLRAATEYLGDGMFICPVNAFIKSYSRYNSGIYVYQFERLIKKNYGKGIDPDTLGVFHYSPFVHFMGPLLPWGDIVNPIDRKFFIESMKMTADFVKTHERPSFRGVAWPDYSKGEGVMVLDETPSVRDNLVHESNCEKVFPFYVKGVEGHKTKRHEL